MKILIDMSPEDYDLFIAECDIKSPAYTILKNAVIAHDPQADPERRSIKILCDEEEAFQLLEAAKRLYPNALPALQRALKTAAK